MNFFEAQEYLKNWQPLSNGEQTILEAAQLVQRHKDAGLVASYKTGMWLRNEMGLDGDEAFTTAEVDDILTDFEIALKKEILNQSL